LPKSWRGPGVNCVPGFPLESCPAPHFRPRLQPPATSHSSSALHGYPHRPVNGYHDPSPGAAHACCLLLTVPDAARENINYKTARGDD
jgi:hypothetical protein